MTSLQERHQVRSARVRRHTVFDNLAPLAEHSADILVPPCCQTPAQCGFFRSNLLVICAAKPRYTAAAAREHRRVLTPRLPTPGASVTSPLHAPREVLFEMCQRRVLLTRMEGEVRQGQFCKWTTTIEGSLEPFCRLTHSIIQARRCRQTFSECSSTLAPDFELRTRFNRSYAKWSQQLRRRRNMLRVTLRSRSLVSASSRALASCSDVKGECVAVAHLERGPCKDAKP